MQGEILISLRSEIPLDLFLCEFSPLFLKQCSCSNNEGIPWRVFESLTHHLLKENNNGPMGNLFFQKIKRGLQINQE